MAPFDVIYASVSDERLSDLLTATNSAGFETPQLRPPNSDHAHWRTVGANASTAVQPVEGAEDFPSSWDRVRELDRPTYAWPTYNEAYAPYNVFVGETVGEGTVHIALGTATRENKWGRDRQYIVAFLTTSAPQTALVEFVETDDYKDTHEFVAVIRGRDGAKSKKMFSPEDDLPRAYEVFQPVVYKDYIRAPGSWAKMSVVVGQDDTDRMLNHALLQARRRGNL
jgi:hypothetical protein